MGFVTVRKLKIPVNNLWSAPHDSINPTHSAPRQHLILIDCQHFSSPTFSKCGFYMVMLPLTTHTPPHFSLGRTHILFCSHFILFYSSLLIYSSARPSSANHSANLSNLLQKYVPSSMPTHDSAQPNFESRWKIRIHRQ